MGMKSLFLKKANLVKAKDAKLEGLTLMYGSQFI